MTHRVRGVAALAAALALLLPLSAEAADDELVITGSRNAYTDITITEPLSLRDLSFSFSRTLPYAGFVLESLDARAPGWFLAALADSTADDGRPVIHIGPGGGNRTPPGRYRVRLFTEAPIRITVNVTNGGRTIRPTSPLRVVARKGTAPLAPGRSDTALRLRNAVPAGFFSLMMASPTGTAYEDAYACPTNSERCPRDVFYPPSPDPNVDPGFRPSSEGGKLTRHPPDKSVRSALMRVNGARVETGTLSALSVAYAP